MIADSSVQRMKGCDCKEYDILYRILYIQRVYILTNNGCVGPEVVLKSTQTKYLQLRSLYRRETCKESIGQRKTSRANSACGQLSAANEGPTVPCGQLSAANEGPCGQLSAANEGTRL